ncbi:7-cyano-7-deazaguanine synthase [Thioalbus denitrificans]|uniref:7-cyano-7-deazaguanine synthase n=1 Tax=Thioalbus denitrificans TaxID=547122 RepID=A0A369CB68_9GAMM|nr:7-cyano-7-deazaguanine synthase [Thioalbus denitrificans]RCX30355.1 7-cyano-7-deazaguanine synthase [Thioalbus denitrificans]
MAGPVAVLVSGGIDSAALAVELAGTHPVVHPLYLRHGLQWEETELAHLRRFLAAAERPALRPVSVLELPVADLYGRHWSLSDGAVPDHSTPDEAVYLPGRNLLFLAKAGVWCERHGVSAIALAPLKGNPFSDNSPEFYAAMERVLELALGFRLEILRPYAALTKAEVIRRSSRLPLELTFSCMDPRQGRHCGRCNKCAERHRAFREAGVEDRTEYAAPPR